ncbi:TetR/AcrR family transcriptional regulator [Lachnospiraceae bacterium 48-42]|jgi:hypothetical protein|nr:TetR/AcrR family transcriptional regulator [Dorea sp.]
MDLRTLKTERAIKNAFTLLRSKKELEKITVKELCEEACINKSTFYAHYRDIYDLSDVLCEEVVAQVAKGVMHPEYFEENPAEFTRELFYAFFAQNSLITILFSGKQRNHLADRIERSIKELIFEKYPEYRHNMTKNIILSYCIQGGYHAYVGNPQCDVNLLIDIIGTLSRSIKEAGIITG